MALAGGYRQMAGGRGYSNPQSLAAQAEILNPFVDDACLQYLTPVLYC